MDPWTILGWFFLIAISLVSTVIGFMVIRGLLIIGIAKLKRYLAWRSTRNMQPEKGQVWVNKFGKELIVDAIWDGGARIGIKSGRPGAYASWSDSYEEFQNRIKNGLRYKREANGGW